MIPHLSRVPMLLERWFDSHKSYANSNFFGTLFQIILHMLNWPFFRKSHKEGLLLLEIPQMKIALAVGYEHHLKTTSSWLWMTYGFFDILEKMNFLQRYVHFWMRYIDAWQWCWWQDYFGDFIMVTGSKYLWQKYY